MPTSFSRILNEDDLTEVRNQYLAALEALEAEENAEQKGEEHDEQPARTTEAGAESVTAPTGQAAAAEAEAEEE
ncbi:hypothetical protein ABZV75_05820 [Streptomyces flaveolus]|uniref:hypothetical protein n=1 Tax=Streptomyces flaveolus TaxID=67297 RepID=UPI0033A71551